MKLQFISLLLLSTELWKEVSGRLIIIGGKEAGADKFPYAVSFQDDFIGHFCDGSLIARVVLLSAA